ncbi:G5 domain-containing protein [Corynebacterium evansiae]|uniref:G5 domain-containing protein n=1 Tax=Corynebacterium evansiae TaxID=2913499 RepID=A0A9X3RF72_9CORY|nr:G5 domain-containing protein [Corynebacterium evansiae]
MNPWPSENIECNPITVSWESFEKHVIVPGDETKVGKINIPDVTGGGTDDSMSRMVVEAYDGNGKFIGTTDPAASGGTKNLRIDEKTGEIYFTWPEYRGTDLATDKNVNFSVLAKPRSVDQLQAAAKSNNEFIEHDGAFNSSNSLTRYNKANVIDSKAFSLDDTEYHSPKYDKTDASIISGVDSATGPLATEPQKVTFTQTPDLIKDLAKKKGDGGYEAKVELDEKYVYDGWTVEMDENYNVTVTAPENPKPGTFARPVVTVEYSNGSTDKLELLVVVDPNNTQVTDLVRPGLAKGTIGTKITAQVGTKSIMKGHKPVHPAKFEIDPATVPDGWTVTVDETGKVTAEADDTVAPGTIITPKVKATYPDQTTDEIETQFQAIVDIKIPTYDTVTNKPAAKVSLKPQVPERGLSGNTTDEAPKRYTFPDGKTEYTVEDDSGKWTVKIDENTGEITTTIPRTAPEGYILNVPVLAYYDNADKPQEVKGTVVVLKSDHAPTYSVESTGPNQAVNHQVQDAPKGSKFSFGNDENGAPITEQEVDGWKYKVDPKTGVVSSTPPADSKPGDKKTINVTVTTPDGSTPLVPVTTVVKLSNNWEAEPVVPSQTVYPGGTATSPIGVEKPEGINLAADKPFMINPEGKGLEATGENNEFGNPTYKVKTANGDWIVGLDDKGNVISTAPETAKPGDKIDVPVIVTYEDGSKDNTTATVNVIDVPKREVPFDVEYKYDDTIPAGEYKVETEGVPGEEKMKKDGTWERTEEPKNEVVVIGTKPAESAKDVEWTFPIPYPTEVRENPALKPGEMKVIQEGENGERTYKAKFTSKGDQASVSESKVTNEPQPRIIEVGPGIPDQELTSKKTQEVPFEIEYVYDDTLESGKQVVDEEGVPGEQTITSTQKIKDGKPDGEPSINIEQTKAPKNAKIRIGTKTTGETKKTVESEVPFGVKIEFDPNLPAGTSETVTEGKPGKKTITVTQKVTNSQPDGEATVEEKVIEQPVDQVIKVGTKPSEASSKVTWTAQVPFEVETRPNPELKPGEVKVVQKGVPGEKTYTADFTAKGDQATVTPEEKQTKDPVSEIIEYGPAAEDTTVVTKVEKPVPFDTEIVFDDSLEEGQQKVDQQGELGTEVVTSTQKIVDGKPSGDPEVNTERTKEPKKQIIRVGTKTTGTNTESVETEIPYDVKVVYDPSLKPGESKVTQEGKPGKKKVTIERDIVNSKPGDPKISEETIEEPVEKIITVGTKPAEATNKATWVAPLPYDTIVRVNPELKPGEMKVVQKGEYGEKEFTADFTAKDNTSTVNTTEKVTKQPVQQIIEYGPKADDSEVVTKLEKPVPFETEIVFDPELKAGEQVVDKQGELGTEVVTSTQKIVDGKPSGEPTVTTERTKEPTNAIIRVGTKPEETKPVSTKVEWTEMTPFETEIRVNPDLQPGETKVVQEGTPGEIKHTVNVTVNNGEVSKEESSEEISKPSPRIIEVGPAKGVETELTDKHTEEIPYDTVIEYDPDLEAGKVVEDQAGKTGSKEITKTWKLVDGQPVGEPETSEEITQPKQDRKIRVGTKCDCKPTEDPKPEDPKPEGPKPEDPKPEDPKPEDPKPEDPKPEDPKPEDPKPEDPKPEDPKPEDPKPEDPKPEDPKPEDPKPEDPKPEDPKPEDPKDPNTPGGSTGSVTPKPSLPGIIGSLGIGGAIVGSGSLGSTPKPDSKQPGKPGAPSKPDAKQPGQPGNADKPGTPGKSSTPSQPGSKGGTSTGSSASSGSSSSQKQVDSPRMSTLASTGANVLGVFAVGLALIIGAIPLLRRRREEGEA